MREAEEQLKTAVKDGDSTRVQELLNGLPPKYSHNVKIAYICLKAALERPSPEEIVRMLLNKFSQISLKQYFFPLLLNIAIKKCNAETVEVLLEHGSDPNTHYSLHFVCETKSSSNVAELLIKFGADVNLVNLKQKAPLHVALNYWSSPVELVQILLEHGADPNLPDGEGMPPLHLAISKGMHLYRIELIIKAGADLNRKNAKGETPVLIVAKKGRDRRDLYSNSRYLDLIDYLTSHGADLTMSDNEGTTPLHAAASKCCLTLVNFLLLKGANVEARDNNNCTPLFLAVKNNCNQVSCHLVHAGANINVHCTNGDALLHVISRSPGYYLSDKTVAPLLLQHHVDLDSKNDEGQTPLFVALKSRNWKVAFKILMWGKPDVMCAITSDSPVFSALAANWSIMRLGYIVRSIASELIRKIILRMSQNLSVNEVHLAEIEGNDQLKAIRDKCNEEINRMKTEVIGGSITYYDVLVKDVNQLASMARNPFLANAFGTIRGIEFSQYGYSLKEAFKKGLERKNLIVGTKRFCEAAFSYLPITCIDKILEYLRDSDLQRLIDVHHPSSWAYYRMKVSQ